MKTRASVTAAQDVCERCGEPAQFFSTEITCEVGDDSPRVENLCDVTVSRSLCIRCAKAEGEYPAWYVRLPLYVFSMFLFIALRPFRRTHRRRFQQKMNHQQKRPDE